MHRHQEASLLKILGTRFQSQTWCFCQIPVVHQNFPMVFPYFSSRNVAIFMGVPWYPHAQTPKLLTLRQAEVFEAPNSSSSLAAKPCSDPGMGQNWAKQEWMVSSKKKKTHAQNTYGILMYIGSSPLSHMFWESRGFEFEAEGIVRFETLVVGFQQDQVTKAPSETRSVPLR